LIPKTVRDALEGLQLSVLYEVRDLVESQISHQEALSSEALPGKREILEVKHEGSVTYGREKVTCGKNCKGCPHGPYWYAYWREGGKTRSKYIGKYLVNMDEK
jgi:hypothetical protein